LKGAGLLVHGGGPTQVMNASLVGVVEQSRLSPDIQALYGARDGIDGVLAGDFIDLAPKRKRVTAISHTPCSALGSSRSRVAPEDYQRIIEVFRTRGVRFVFFTAATDRCSWRIRSSARLRRVVTSFA
jgi:6-phosphofructokinase